MIGISILLMENTGGLILGVGEGDGVVGMETVEGEGLLGWRWGLLLMGRLGTRDLLGRQWEIRNGLNM